MTTIWFSVIAQIFLVPSFTCFGDYVEKFVDLENPPVLPPAPSTLKYVFAISRSGTRAPLFDPLPKERGGQDFKTYWGVEKGEMTQYGEQLMTALGKSLSTRYKGFIDSLTSHKIVTAADSKRTVKSAELVAEQLFGSKEITSKDTESFDKYRLFSQTDRLECKQFHQDRQSTIDYFNEKDPYPTADAINKYIGGSNPVTFLKMMEMYDTLDMQKANYKGMNNELARIHQTEHYDIFLNKLIYGKDWNLKGYTAGPLYHQILKELDECGETCKGFHLHMTHSLILTAAMSEVRLYTSLPLVGTTFIIELHENNQVTILLYQPLAWEKPGTLYQADNGNWLVVSMKEMCGMELGVKVPYPVFCDLNTFRSTLIDWSPERWQRRCDGRSTTLKDIMT